MIQPEYLLSTAPPYQLRSAEKKRYLLQELDLLTQFHKLNCNPYGKICNALSLPRSPKTLADLPFLPVRLFKMYDFLSVPRDQVFKTITSSGTTSQMVSRVYLDRSTAKLQTKTLAAIITSFVGKQRLPMILVDSVGVLKNRQSFNARGAGVVGMANFGRDHFYLLDERMNFRWEELQTFLAKHDGEKILVFGFTFMIWQYFYLHLKQKNINLHLSNSILIHSGGWKKLYQEAVDNTTFKRRLFEQTGIPRIHNFYGMAEQVGSIFMECESGFLHAPDMADIIIRDPDNFQPLLSGKEGIVEVLSVVPRSYPGHILLTEDLGTIIGEDDCRCGRKGKYFIINGRLPAAELRGCSDTHAAMLGELN